MVKKVFVLEREKNLDFYLKKFGSWCILPDGTFAGTSVLDGICKFTHWDTTKSDGLTCSTFSINDGHSISNEIFSISNHRVLSFLMKKTREVCVSEWDYKNNVVIQHGAYLTHYRHYPLHIQELGNERFLVLCNKEFLIYDPHKQNWNRCVFYNINISSGFNHIEYHFFREIDEGKRLSFVSEYGDYYEGSLEENDHLDGKNKIFARNTSNRRCFYLDHIESKDILQKSTCSIETRLIKALANGDVLLMETLGDLWCSNPSNKSAPFQKFQRAEEMDNINHLMELKNGLILGYGDARDYISIWDRKGTLLRNHKMPFLTNQLIMESNQLDIVEMGSEILGTLRLIHNEESLVNRCCYVLAELVEEGTLTVGILSDHLPSELVELCVGFLDDTKSESEMMD